MLTLLPAVDVTEGQAVRLVHGEAGTETGYGDPMEACLEKHYAKLSPACKAVVDRIKGGEKVSLF